MGTEAEARQLTKPLETLAWLLTTKGPQSESVKDRSFYIPSYGDLTDLNSCRVLLDSIGKDLLREIVFDYLELLETSAAVYERTGDYALGISSSSWCRFLCQASRELCNTDDNSEALASGRWHCHESCWTKASKVSIERGEPVDKECLGGLRIYAVPIFSGGEVVGSMNFGYGDPPSDPEKLREIAKRYEVRVEELIFMTRQYRSRPPFIIEVSKKLLLTSAGLMGEIVERREIQEALRLGETKYEALLEGMRDGVAVYEAENDGEDFIFVDFNSSAERIDDVRREDIVGKRVTEVFPGVIDFGLLKVFQRVWKTGKPEHFPVAFYKDERIAGRRENHVYRLPSREIVAVYSDETEINKAEEALRESEERYKSVIDNVGIGVSLINPDMEILALNRQMKEWFPSIDETGKPICYRAFNDPPRDQICDYCPTRKTLADGERHEAVTSTPTGRGIKHYKIVSTPIKDENSRVVSAIELVEDITEKKRSGEDKHRFERELRQAQKLEAIGTLAGGVAHDFNNILASIMGYAELAADDAPKGSMLEAHLQEIFRGGRRAADLVKQILAFSRQTDEERRPIQIAPLVNEALKLLRSSLPTTVDIRPHIETRMDNVLADPTQIHQIVMNLCANAAHAMRQDGGILEVDLRQVELDSDSMAEHLGMTPGSYLRLTVSDTGHGMPPETLERIFEPYFTTKEKGEGTGMGLSVVHGIARTCGGTIKAYSEPGNGTTINVYLPATKGEARAEREPITPLPTGNERILFVDDEPPLVDLGIQRLERLGYDVTPRTSSIEALNLFKAKPAAFDLVITDMTMPHMTGDRLAGEMIKVRPDIPVILCTGYSTQISEERAKGIGIRAFAMKPIVTRELAEMVRQVLDDKEEEKTDCIRCSP